MNKKGRLNKNKNLKYKVHKIGNPKIGKTTGQQTFTMKKEKYKRNVTSL